MASCSTLFSNLSSKGWPHKMLTKPNFNLLEWQKLSTRRACNYQTSSCKFNTSCSLGVTACASIKNPPFDIIGSSGFVNSLFVADLDPSTAKLAVSILGPCFSALSFLFIVRIVMSWYPKLPLGKFPYVIAYFPTEPFLGPTRKIIPPLGGVDVTPVVWFGLVSFTNEILVGPQGLLVLLSQQLS